MFPEGCDIFLSLQLLCTNYDLGPIEIVPGDENYYFSDLFFLCFMEDNSPLV
jgi:hypothetical protein